MSARGGIAWGTAIRSLPSSASRASRDRHAHTMHMCPMHMYTMHMYTMHMSPAEFGEPRVERWLALLSSVLAQLAVPGGGRLAGRM